MITTGEARRKGAIRANDFAMLMCLFWGGLFVADGQFLEMTKTTGPLNHVLAAIAFVAVIVVPLVARARLRRATEFEDEYLKRLAGTAAAAGFYLAVAVFVVWTPLTGSMLPALTAPQVIGLMLLGGSLTWFALRWHHSH